MNFLAEIEKLARNIQVPETNNTKSDLKRKADEISQSNYEDTNKELRELYLARQRVRQEDLPSDKDPNNPVEKIQINLSKSRSNITEGKIFLISRERSEH